MRRGWIMKTTAADNASDEPQQTNKQSLPGQQENESVDIARHGQSNGEFARRTSQASTLPGLFPPSPSVCTLRVDCRQGPSRGGWLHRAPNKHTHTHNYLIYVEKIKQKIFASPNMPTTWCGTGHQSSPLYCQGRRCDEGVTQE